MSHVAGYQQVYPLFHTAGYKRKRLNIVLYLKICNLFFTTPRGIPQFLCIGMVSQSFAYILKLKIGRVAEEYVHMFPTRTKCHGAEFPQGVADVEASVPRLCAPSAKNIRPNELFPISWPGERTRPKIKSRRGGDTTGKKVARCSGYAVMHKISVRSGIIRESSFFTGQFRFVVVTQRFVITRYFRKSLSFSFIYKFPRVSTSEDCSYTSWLRG